MKNQKYIDELKWRLQTFRKLDALDFMNAMGNYLNYPETDSLLNDHEMMFRIIQFTLDAYNHGQQSAMENFVKYLMDNKLEKMVGIN